MIKQLFIRNQNEAISTILYEVRNPKICAIFIHSYTNWKDEKDYIYCRIARRLTSISVTSVLFDMRGHGESSMNLENVNINTMIEDIIKIIHYVKSNICQQILLVTCGISARLALEAVKNIFIKDIIMISPAINLPISLKQLANFSGCTFAEALSKVQNKELVINDLKRIGILPRFVQGELINPDLYSMPDYKGRYDYVNILAFLYSSESCKELDYFTRKTIVSIDKGGIALRSPVAIDLINQYIINFTQKCIDT